MKYFVDFLQELKSGTTYPVYLFYGPERYLIQQAVGRLKQYLLPPGGEQFNYQVLEGDQVQVADITAAAGESSFMPGKKLVQVLNPGFIRPAAKKKASGTDAKKGPGEPGSSPAQGQLKADEKAYLAYLKQPVPDTSLVLVAGDSVDRRKKVYKETYKQGKAVEFTRLRAQEVKKWLNQTAAREGCRLEPGAAQVLLDRCGVDLFTLYQEINKLICYVGPGQTITTAAAEQLVSASVEESIFQVVDAIGLGNAPRALAGVRSLLLQKYPTEFITGMVARQLRLMVQVGRGLEAGATREQIIADLKLHSFVYHKISRQVRGFSPRQWAEHLHLLLAMDQQVKTGQQKFYPAMEMFILQVCAQKQ